MGIKNMFFVLKCFLRLKTHFVYRITFKVQYTT